jgi:hypothetical protein
VPRNCATVEIGWEGRASKQSMGGGDDKLLFFLLFFLLFWLYFALCSLLRAVLLDFPYGSGFAWGFYSFICCSVWLLERKKI